MVWWSKVLNQLRQIPHGLQLTSSTLRLRALELWVVKMTFRQGTQEMMIALGTIRALIQIDVAITMTLISQQALIVAFAEEEPLPLMMLGRMLILIWSRIMHPKVLQRRGLNLHIPAHSHALVRVVVYPALTNNLEETLCLELLKHASVLMTQLITHSKVAPPSPVMIDVSA